MDIWFERKTELTDVELKEFGSYCKKDSKYYDWLLGDWNPREAVDEYHPLIVLKKNKKCFGLNTPYVAGWLSYTCDNGRVSHYVGKLKWENTDAFWGTKNIYIFHIYICPELRNRSEVYDRLLEEAEKDTDNIWAIIYKEEDLYKEVLKGRKYSYFERVPELASDVEMYYKGKAVKQEE